ncbi:MAG: outer membrane beta-barrel protein [Terriglobales bacterium]
MEKLVRIALAALFLVGIASAQNIPAVDVFGGYSYLNFDVPSSSVTTSGRLALNGWDFSVAVGQFHHFSIEGDLSGHQLGDCGGTPNLNCSDFSYMIGPRYTVGDRSSRLTGFVHGLVGQDRADFPISGGTTVSDTSLAFAAGAGVDYWPFRHIGVQLGPVDFLYTRHLNNYDGNNVPSQSNFRASAGIVFRFGGNLPSSEPKPPKEPKAESKSDRSRNRPWHKNKSAPSESQPSESQPSTVAVHRPAQPSVTVLGRGMSLPALGVVVTPQEFDGAKILEIVPGGVAEMASLHAGDLIRSVDGKAVKTPMELAAELSDKSGKVRISILRGDVATETVILLGR